MDEVKMREKLDYSGVPYIMPIYDGVAKLRVMDLTQVSDGLRVHFDERGFFVEPKDKEASKGKKK
jgi:hypothetical protein